jgi:hypothetical protein
MNRPLFGGSRQRYRKPVDRTCPGQQDLEDNPIGSPVMPGFPFFHRRAVPGHCDTIRFWFTPWSIVNRPGAIWVFSVDNR